MVYRNVKRERHTDLKIRDKGKEDHGHSQQIKLNNFNVSLWDKREEILYPISTTTVHKAACCSGLGICLLASRYFVQLTCLGISCFEGMDESVLFWCPLMHKTYKSMCCPLITIPWSNSKDDHYWSTTQPDSHYIRYTAASVLRSTTLSTPEEHWLTCAWLVRYYT